MAETLTEQRRAVLSRITALDREVATLSDPAERARFERSHAGVKAEAARYMPDRPELAAFAQPDEGGRYRGVPVGADPMARELAAQAGRRVAALAQEAGLDGATTAARYASDAAAPRRLAEQWEREERTALARSLSAQGREVGADGPEVGARLRELREKIDVVHASAAAEIEAVGAARARLGRAAERGGPVTQDGVARTEQDLERLLSAEEKRAILERGAEGARAVAPGEDGARVLARIHLAAVARDESRDAATREQARATLAGIEARPGVARDGPQASRDGQGRDATAPDDAADRAPKAPSRRRDDDGHGL